VIAENYPQLKASENQSKDDFQGDASSQQVPEVRF
jgi:hypothetical protein